MSAEKKLTETVRKYQDSTGEGALLVMLEDDDQKPMGLHQVGWDENLGMLVDGDPATAEFTASLDVLTFRALQEPPRLLH